MLSIIEIFKGNYSTFYNYRTGKNTSVIPNYCRVVLISVLLSIAFGKPHDDLYTGLISVQSIIVGFAFNVLFYLSSNPIVVPNASDSLEDEAKVEKLRKLGNEVFYNISYFNLVAIFSIILSCCVLMINAYALAQFPSFVLSLPRINEIQNLVETYKPFALRLLICVTFCFTIESFFTFIRIVKRMTYLFRERIKLGTG